MTTLKDKFVTTLPNMTMRSVYMDYYNQLNKIEAMHNVMFLCIGTMIPIEAWNHSFRIISNNIWDNSRHKFLIRSMKTLSGVLSTNWYRVI